MNTGRTKGASAPFSAYSRGVQLASRGSFDLSNLLESGGRQLIDISGGIVTLVLAAGWFSFFNLVITICANSFYTFLGFASVAAPLDFSILSFVVILPLVLSAFHALQRRNQALADLSLVKTLILHLSLAHSGPPAEQAADDVGQEVTDTLVLLTNAMHAYFTRPRFYTRHFPLTEVRGKMVQVAQARSRATRRILQCFRRLHAAQQRSGEGQAGTHAASMLLQLHTTFERMANVKEFRTPVGLRAMLLVYVVVIIPLFFGPYYAFIRSPTVGFTFALFLAIVLNQSIMTVYMVTVALEDPFNSQGLDSIFVDEAFTEAQQAILAGRGPVHESEMDGEDDNEDEESPRADKGNDVVMPVDGLPLPPDSRAGNVAL